MTFSDLWIDDLSGGPSLHQHGHLFGPAIDVATVLLEFVQAGRATVNSQRHFVGDVELTINGLQLIEAFVEAEKRSGRTLVEHDGRRSVDYVEPDHVYRCWYVES